MSSLLLQKIVSAGITSALVLSGSPTAFTATPEELSIPAPPPLSVTQLSEYRPEGVDIASHQHPGNINIDYGKVRATGTRFVLVKATEGLTYFNDHYIHDRASATKAGLITGSYHYARPERVPGSAREQAKYFSIVTLASRLPGDLPPVLDIEESGGLSPAELQAWTAEFVATIEALSGRSPIIYTYPSFWRVNMGNTHMFSRYKLWIADYNGRENPTFPLPGGWDKWTFWQYSSTGRVNGIPARVDKNIFHGSLGELHKLRF